MDHELYNEELLAKATAAILKTRDGLLRDAVPSTLGSRKFLNDVTDEEMAVALRRRKSLMKKYPRHGAGIDSYVDASDTGYTVNAPGAKSLTSAHKVSDGASGSKKRVLRNGVMSGLQGTGLQPSLNRSTRAAGTAIGGSEVKFDVQFSRGSQITW